MAKLSTVKSRNIVQKYLLIFPFLVKCVAKIKKKLIDILKYLNSFVEIFFTAIYSYY